jgi:uncharacterized protein (DUF305 family)
MLSRILALIIVATALSSQCGYAQQSMNDMPMAQAGAARGGGASDLMASMDTMNKAMNAVPMTGDVDRDFVAMMIAHHQGAVDMCGVELKSGKDPILKKLCREIIASQTKEIALMRHWQQRHVQTR